MQFLANAATRIRITLLTVFFGRVIKPFFDILQSYQGYRTCYYRTFNIGRATPGQNDAYIKARDWLDAAIALIKPGGDHRQNCRRVGPQLKALVFQMNLQRSACSLAMAWDWPCMSGQLSVARSVSKIQWKFRPAWCLRWKPIAQPLTAILRRGLRKK